MKYDFVELKNIGKNYFDFDKKVSLSSQFSLFIDDLKGSLKQKDY